MKLLLLLLASLAPCLARAQGTVMFYNHVPFAGVDAPVFDINGVTRVSGEGYWAQLYAGPDAGRLAPVGTPRPFQTGAGAGYWQPDVVVIPGVAAGTATTGQVRAWQTGTGTTLLANGVSEIFTLKTGGAASGDLPPGFPAYLTGLKSFQLLPVPEPTVTALALLGAGLLIRGFPTGQRD